MKDISKDNNAPSKSIDMIPEDNPKSTDDFKYDELKEMKEESNFQTIKQLKEGLRKTKEDKVIIGKNDLQGSGTVMTLNLDLKKDKDGKPISIRKDF